MSEQKRDREAELETGTKSASGWAIMDKAWERMQQKTFTNWTNSQLKKKGHAVVKDVVKDMETGIPLMNLTNALWDAPVPKHSKNPRMRVHKLDNISMALEKIEEFVKLHFVKPGHLADQDTKMILGMIWTIIHDYQVADISVEELTAKEGLLLWCQRKTANYKTPPRDVHIKNFTDTWADGLGFCALIHKHRPDLIDYESLDKANAMDNLALAFGVAEKELDIPALLDPEDLVNSVPDERSVITYVSEYFHKFASSDKLETAGDRIGRLLDLTQQNKQLAANYDERAAALNQWTTGKTGEMNERDFPDDIPAIKGLIADLKRHRTEDKPPQAKEKTDLEGLWNQLQTSLKLNKRPAYQAPEGLDPDSLGVNWRALQHAENERARALREKLRRSEESDILQRRWASRTRKFNLRSQLLQEDAQEIVAEAKAASAIDTVRACETQFEAVIAEQQGLEDKDLAGLVALNGQLSEAGLSETKYTEATLASVNADWAASKQAVAASQEALRAEVEAEQAREVLRQEFAGQADATYDWVSGKTEEVNGANAEDAAGIDAALATLTQINQDVAGYEPEFEKLGDVNGRVEEAQIWENPHTNHTYEEISAIWEALPDLLRGKQSLLSNQKLSLAGTEVTPEQLEDYSSTFKIFDKDNDSHLLSHELLACLGALGQATTEAELAQIFAKWGKTKEGALTFEEFVAYMVASQTDSQSEDGITAAFSALSGGSDVITKEQMQPFLSPEQLAYALENMPASEDGTGYIWKPFVQSLFA